MLALGLDTSTPAVTVALVDTGTGRVLAASEVVDARRHGELLAAGVAGVLSRAGCAPGDLGAVVVGLGPGPFTGLRVGVATAAALADALGLPAYGVCSLDAVELADGVVVTDARRREVYWARYAGGVRVAGPAVERPAELAARLGPAGVVAGDGALVHREAFAGCTVREQPRYPCAAALVRRAADRFGTPGEVLVPLYLRRPDAVVPGATKRATA